jgi:outer membrane protein assembly factor BamB
VIVSCAENYSSGTGGYAGTTWIGAFSRATGAVLWTTHFSDAYQQTTAVTPPLIAADGNIFLSTGTSFSVPQDGEPFPHNYGQVSAYKLAT